MSDDAFNVVRASLVLSVPPVFAADPRAGVCELLDSLLMRYSAPLQGVLLAHSNIEFSDKVAHILGDCPFLVCKIAFDATIWSPKIGQRLAGSVNLCSPDHISLLMHKTFNASIPREHIPRERWEYEEERWIDKLSGEAVDGRVEFKVVGLGVANEMLSVIGSLA